MSIHLKISPEQPGVFMLAVTATAEALLNITFCAILK
jgi:hypothetical protein